MVYNRTADKAETLAVEFGECVLRLGAGVPRRRTACTAARGHTSPATRLLILALSSLQAPSSYLISPGPRH